MNNDENVPANIPTNNAKTKPRIVSPPKMKIANNTTIVVPDVLIERNNVLLFALLKRSFQPFLGKRLTFSRTRSKITTVLLIE